MKTIAVVHTGPVSVQPIKEQISELIPDARVINIVDDSLLNDVRAAGHVTPEVASRIHSYMSNAQAMRVDIILNACSSVGEAVDSVRNLISTPIVKIDEAMAEEACSIDSRIGVIATVPTTLEPTVRLVKKKAGELQRAVEVTERIAEGAFEALLSGDGARHDQIVKSAISTLAAQVGVIVLAQVSMARLVPQLEGVRVPVLSSLRSGVAALKRALDNLPKVSAPSQNR
ncbi:MAG TPA: aspartate/glutamate racemase family protein [Trinickia sp.]|uniref:aspartate/glutamate racemase family protein n=1 Tax=Trinickia sp. TaxID=2571163 RepID=UPI002BA8EF15|nr:aspartate/glutamate racemase family protein [Trinickia sp.]HVW51810.1 aspartate/glutamate racemase family protein [Trinickia sp.]